MKARNFKIPVFGVGPFYVIVCALVTVLALIFHAKGFFDFANLNTGNFFFILLGIVFVICGLNLWIRAVVFQKINKNVLEDKLITTGVYSIVRNPVYSAFLFVFTGTLIFSKNYILFTLPIFYYIFLSMLMKNTEEIWLLEKFGKEYQDYCKKVNRVIPFFSKD